MSANRLLPALCLGLALHTLPGCANRDGSDHHDGVPAPRPQPAATTPTTGATAQNARTADELLKEATDAEGRGEYPRALEAYQYLRGFPEPTRPKDLEQRVDALKKKMESSSGR